MSNEVVPVPAKPDDIDSAEWAENLSEPSSYSGVLPDRSREKVVPQGDGTVLARFREILVQTQDLDWVAKTLDGLSQKMLWRDDTTGASIALLSFKAGTGIPSRHAHAANQFMFCLKGTYTYLPTHLSLRKGSFYWNPKGSVHGPSLAEEDSILLEIFDGPHYPSQPTWYSTAEDAN